MLSGAAHQFLEHPGQSRVLDAGVLGVDAAGPVDVRQQTGPALTGVDDLAGGLDVAEGLREHGRRVPADGLHEAQVGAGRRQAGTLGVGHGPAGAAGVTPEYVELRGLDLGRAPEEGDARLFGAATVGGVRLTDNVGLPIGIGFRNLEPEQDD